VVLVDPELGLVWVEARQRRLPARGRVLVGVPPSFWRVRVKPFDESLKSLFVVSGRKKDPFLRRGLPRFIDEDVRNGAFDEELLSNVVDEMA